MAPFRVRRATLPLEFVRVLKSKVQGATQGAAPMCVGQRHINLHPCLGICCSTITRRTNVASSSPRSRATRARFATRVTLTSCRSGGHEVWWTVDAASEQQALRLLPDYVAKRTTVARVSQVEIP